MWSSLLRGSHRCKRVCSLRVVFSEDEVVMSLVVIIRELFLTKRKYTSAHVVGILFSFDTASLAVGSLLKAGPSSTWAPNV